MRLNNTAKTFMTRRNSVKASRIRAALGKGAKTHPRKEGDFRGKAQNIRSG